ncbi:protein of unknown function [Georgfuchsia toluolica]|uniref:histidine kinase n=1 Tax=Georgfuchsia toluolica TaxID=424218 RepID=A0A916N1X2_9PROT|nr:protein of unknown function [Georgfuchsia toluolica]
MANKRRMDTASPSSLDAKAQSDADASSRWPELPAPDRLVHLLKRLTLLFATLVVVGLPGGYFSLKYSSLVEHVELSAQVRAAKITSLATANPELWVRQRQDMEEVLLMTPPPLGNESETVRDAFGIPLVVVGVSPQAPIFIRSSPIYVHERIVGEVEIAHSYRQILTGTLAAGLLGLLLGVLVYATILALPLRALRRSSAALKHEKQALHDSEEHYRTLFSRAMDGILLLDMEGNVVNVNDSFARMHGYSIDEMRDMSLHGFDTPGTLTQSAERLARIMAGESLEFGVEHIHKDGHIVPLEVTASAIDINGKKFTLAYHRDISEKVKNENELRVLQAELHEFSVVAQSLREREKGILARELHDELGQALTALKMDVAWIMERLPAGAEFLMGKLANMQIILNDTMISTRRISTNLRPLILDDLGLIPAVEWLVENFREHSGIDCQLAISDPCLDLPEPYATAVFRILQESLTNISKHAQASLVKISINRTNDEAQLTVRDNGRGFVSTSPRKPDSFGLMGLRERAHLIGGTIYIDSAPGRGTVIDLLIPIGRSEAGYQDFSV